MSATLYCGDSLAVLQTLPDGAARCCVTSPPYFQLRDYGVEGQMGLESTPDAYVARMVDLFREVRRVLADDGTLWLNMGDTYTGGKAKDSYCDVKSGDLGWSNNQARPLAPGLKPKDLIGIPWRVAFALQSDGWYLRSDIIWHKPNPMPESVTDRPTKAHEYVFLLSKSERYCYDADAIAEEASPNQPWSASSNGGAKAALVRNGGNSEGPGKSPAMRKSGNKERKTGEDRGRPGSHLGGSIPWEGFTRNARTVWTIATRPYAGAHFATMPPELAERCILAGSAPGDTVLDPFGGSGTTAAVAVGHGRRAIHIDLNPAYIELARERIGPILCVEEGVAVP